MDHTKPQEVVDIAGSSTVTNSVITDSANPSSHGAWLAAMIASCAFLIPGGIAFVWFGGKFYR